MYECASEWRAAYGNGGVFREAADRAEMSLVLGTGESSLGRWAIESIRFMKEDANRAGMPTSGSDPYGVDDI
jgi:hypothetical protein